MRTIARFCITFFMTLACVHCGTAYTYVPSPTSSDTSTTGSTSTTSTGSSGQTGGTGAGASTGSGTAGGTSAGGTTGVTVSLFNLQVDGDGFGGQGFRGNMVDQSVSAQVLNDANQKVGGVVTGSVQGDGTFTLDFNAVLNPNTAYNVALFVDTDHNGQCDDRDSQFLVSIPATNQDVDVQLSRNGQQEEICNDFQ